MVKTILYKRTIALGKSTDFRKDVRRSEPRGDSGGSVPVSVLSVSVCLSVCVCVYLCLCSVLRSRCVSSSIQSSSHE